MLEKSMDKLADGLVERGITKSEDKSIIAYGLSAGIELLLGIITTIILGLIFGLILESLVFLVAFSFIRTYAGGYHCQKAINCYLISSGTVALLLTIVKTTPKENMISLSVAMLIVAIPILLKLAPIETPSKPLDQDEKIYYNKKMTRYLAIECLLACILYLFQFNNFAFIICLGIMVSSGLVLLEYKNNKVVTLQK